MSSYILRIVRPSNLQNWIKVNAAGSLKGTPKDSWWSYLKANGGTGSTFHDLEHSFLTAQVVASGRLPQRWALYLAGQSGSKPVEKARNNYK